jgi:hypothetical protein
MWRRVCDSAATDMVDALSDSSCNREDQVFTAPRRLAVRTLAHRTATAGAVAVVVLTSAVTLASPATSAPRTATTAKVHEAKPGVSGAAITLASQVTLDGDKRDVDLATDRSGRTYVAWISAPVSNSSSRQVHLCTLPLHATACAGGVQAIDTPDASTAGGIRVLATAAGAVTILWYHTHSGGGNVSEATSSSGGPLSSATNVVNGPQDAVLADAELGPGNSIWTVVAPESGSGLQVTPGIGKPATTISTGGQVNYARLVFAGSTAIIATSEFDGAGGFEKPIRYASRQGSSWTGFKTVAGTETDGDDFGLTRTSAGVRLTAPSAANELPAVAKWTGHAFTRAVAIGDHSTCVPSSYSTFADASGRLASVSNECGTFSVDNLPATTHAAISRFSGGDTAAGDPQIASLPRGYAWVAWTVQFSSNALQGDKLKIVPLLLPGLGKKASHGGAHGSVTLTGPTSCQPNDTLAVGVAGHAKPGWTVGARKLTLAGKKIGHSLNGAALTPGKAYSLKGTVVFSHGGSHSTVTATLKFRSCPNP